MSDPITVLADHGIGGVLVLLAGLSVGVWALVWVVWLLAARLSRPWRARRALRMPPIPGPDVSDDRVLSGQWAAPGEPLPEVPESAYGPDAVPLPPPVYAKPDRRPQVYRSRGGLLWEDAPDSPGSVRVFGHHGLAWPRDEMDRLYGLTPINTPEDDA